MVATQSLKTEIAVPGWTDISDFVYQRDQVIIQRARQNEASTIQTAECDLTLNNRDNRFTTRNPVGAYYPYLVKNTPLRASTLSSDFGIPCYLRMEADQSSYASTPDSVPLQITSGTLSVRIDCKPTDSRQASLFAKWGSTAKSWALFQNDDGTVTLYHWDGTNQFSEQSTLPLPYYGQRIAIRADYNISGKTITFYTAPNLVNFLNTAASGSVHNDDFEDGTIGTWRSDGNTSMVNSTAQAHSGTHSMLMTSQAAGQIAAIHANAASTVNAFPCVPGQQIQASAWFRAATVSRNCTVTCRFEKSDGTFISYIGGPAVANNTTGWVQATDGGQIIAPAGAAWCFIDCVVAATAGAGEQHYTDDIILGGPWTQLGATVTTLATVQSAGVGQIIQVGTSNFAGMYGEVYEAQILSTSTVVADPVFTSQTAGATSFVDAHSNTWSLSGTAELSNRLYRFHGELGSFPKTSDPSAKDVYSQAAAYGVSKRLQNSNTPLNSPMKRSYLRLPSSLNLAGYWSGEDSSGATQIGQSIGKFAMSSAGLTMSSFSGFASSAPLPVMNGGTASAVVDPSSVTWTDNVVRCLLAVPAAGDTDGAIVARASTNGTGPVSYFTLTYRNQFGGTLSMQAYSPAGALLRDTGVINSFSINGKTVRVSANIKKNGANLDMEIEVLNTGASVGLEFTSSSIATGSVAPVTGVAFGGGLSTSAMGHWSVQGTWDTLFDLSGPMNAWFGETAGNRYSRLCSEEGIACRIVGPPGASIPMGNQPIDTLFDILQQCEKTDLGMMFETKQVLGLGYRTRSSMYNQSPLCTADYSSGQLFQGFASTDDTLLVVNDVTANAIDGSSARQFLASGVMSVQDPPNGIGRIDTTIQPNPQYDSALSQIAGWFLNVRSVDDDRYPAVPFEMTRSETPASAVLLDVGDFIEITTPPGWLPTGPIKQIAVGFTETFFPGAHWELSINVVPEKPYETAILNDAVYGHLDTAGTVLGGTITSGATSLLAVTTIGPLWTTAAGDLPFDIGCEGEQVSVTAIGASQFNGTSGTGFEDGATDGYNPNNGTVANSIAQAHSGTHSLLWTLPGGFANPIVFGPQQDVAAGIPYYSGGWVFSASTYTVNWTLHYHDKNGVSVSNVEGPTTTLVANTWTSVATVSPNALAPAGSATVLFGLRINGTPAAGSVFLDDTAFGPSLSQIFTITRSVNGIVKAHSAGAAISLFHPMILRL